MMNGWMDAEDSICLEIKTVLFFLILKIGIEMNTCKFKDSILQILRIKTLNMVTNWRH